MKNKLFPYICWLTAITFSLQLQAQNKVSAPMADVNQVIDNTLDSRDRKPVRAGKVTTLFCFW